MTARHSLFPLTVLILIVVMCNTSSSQIKLSLKDNRTSLQYENFKLNQDNKINLLDEKISKTPSFTKTGSVASAIVYGLIILPNPMLLHEKDKFYFGLTKQVSFLPFKTFEVGMGMFAFEYSYIFGKDNPNHIRASYVQNFIISTYFTAPILAFEGGYFTDLKKNGISASAGLNILLAFFSPFYVNPYVKLRHTFMLKDNPDITDFSLGIGIGLYSGD